jgi:hypothetical protein
MDKFNKRLLKLAKHLQVGKLGADRFNYNIFYTKTASCGTAACAVGECPTIFKSWKLKKIDNFGIDILPIYKNYQTPTDSAREFFNLTEKEFNYLFIPLSKTYFGKAPMSIASAKEVGEHIENFVKKRTAK